jgi:aspartyl-tRNA synthetase
MKLYIIPLYYRQSIRNYGIDSADYKDAIEIKSSRTKMKKTAAHIYGSKIVTMTTHFLEKDPD